MANNLLQWGKKAYYIFVLSFVYLVKHKTQLVKTELAPTTTFSDFHVWISVFTLPLECCFVCLFVFNVIVSRDNFSYYNFVWGKW